jgi:hypothetical protein
MSQDTGRRCDGIKTIRHAIDWNHLAWQPLQRLSGMTDLPLLGEESEEFAVVSKILLKGIRCPGWCYANPAYTAVAPPETSEVEFLAVVKRLQQDWLKQLRSQLARSSSLKRERKRLKRHEVHPLVWRLAVTGILLFKNSQQQLCLA